MPALSISEQAFTGTVLGTFFYGIYIISFTLYLSSHRKPAGFSPLVYPLSVLFTLCTCYLGINLTVWFFMITRPAALESGAPMLYIDLAQGVILSCVVIISQGVLIYCCGLAWRGKSIIAVVVPSFLALASFATCIALVIVEAISKRRVPGLLLPLAYASFSLSLAVNVIVTGLLILKMTIIPSNFGRRLAGQETRKFGRLALTQIFLDSGIFTVLSQLAWVLLFYRFHSWLNAIFSAIIMLSGMTPTVVVLRATMKASIETYTMVEDDIEAIPLLQ